MNEHFELKPEAGGSFGEKIFPVPLDVAVARIQRKFLKMVGYSNYDFDEKRNIFTLYEDREVHIWKIRYGLIVRLYAETNGRSVAEYEVTFRRQEGESIYASCDPLVASAFKKWGVEIIAKIEGILSEQ